RLGPRGSGRRHQHRGHARRPALTPLGRLSSRQDARLTSDGSSSDSGGRRSMGRRLSIPIVVTVSALVAVTGGPVAGASPGPSAAMPVPSSAAPAHSFTPDGPRATRELLRDTFDTPGPWWIGTDEVGTNQIADGGLRWTFAQDRRSQWDTR